MRDRARARARAPGPHPGAQQAGPREPSSANLTLARTASRRHELATRLALGASRSRLIRQLVIESLIVALASVPAGILLARWGRALLIGRTAGPEVYEATSIDVTVLLFSIGLAVLASVLSGLLPAWHAVRRLHADILTAGGRTDTTGPRHSLLSRALIATEVALAVILLVGAAVFLERHGERPTRSNGGTERNGGGP